jgi:hypothetical protein
MKRIPFVPNSLPWDEDNVMPMLGGVWIKKVRRIGNLLTLFGPKCEFCRYYPYYNEGGG